MKRNVLMWLNGFLSCALFVTLLSNTRIPSEFGSIADPNGFHARTVPFLDGSNFDQATGTWYNPNLTIHVGTLIADEYVQTKYIQPTGMTDAEWNLLLLDSSKAGAAGTIISGTEVTWVHIEHDADKIRLVPWETYALGTPGTDENWHIARQQPDGSLELEAVNES